MKSEIQHRFRAALKGQSPADVFQQWDKDGEGSLDLAEFKKLVRAGLQIKPLDMPDTHVEALMESLDDDGGGGISAEEIEDFLLV